MLFISTANGDSLAPRHCTGALHCFNATQEQHSEIIVFACTAQESGSGDDDLVFGTGEDTGELGMAEESVLRSIPAHRLRALEKQQIDATLSNNATRARHLPGFARQER